VRRKGRKNEKDYFERRRTEGTTKTNSKRKGAKKGERARVAEKGTIKEGAHNSDLRLRDWQNAPEIMVRLGAGTKKEGRVRSSTGENRKKKEEEGARGKQSLTYSQKATNHKRCGPKRSGDTGRKKKGAKGRRSEVPP